MTIDEAIKHYDEIAKEKEHSIGIYINDSDKECLCKCASEYRQLAEWLKRLVIISNAKVEIIRRIEDAKSKDKLCEYPYIRCIDIVKEVFGDDK